MRLLGVVAAEKVAVLLIVLSAVTGLLYPSCDANPSAQDTAHLESVRESVDLVILHLVDDSIEISFAHPAVIDGSVDVELNASVSNLTVDMSVSLHMRHALTNIASTYSMQEEESTAFVARVPSPVTTGVHHAWVTVDNESSCIASTPETPMTIVDATDPTIWSYGIRFEAGRPIFHANCSDEYGVESVKLRLSTDDPLRGSDRDFTLVNGTFLNGSWEYSTELDKDSYIQYSISISDGKNLVLTGWISHNDEALINEMLTDLIVTAIILLLVVVVAVAIVVAALRTRAKQV
jgi:hypothetical protein